MKKLAATLLAFTLLSLGATRSAKAQDFSTGDAFAGLDTAGLVIQGVIAAGGTVTGIKSSLLASRREVSPGWFAATYTFGALNTGLAILSVNQLVNYNDSPAVLSFAIAHASVAAFDLIARRSASSMASART